ncbi:MAG: hypothetical protein Q9220_000844 [cf. Caloplaca sp. 1 TL-2023]
MRHGKRHSLHLELPNVHADELPHIAALFLVRFDVRTGYAIAWKKSLPGLDVANSVEYKSLPSGLHNVQKDTIYFVHDDEYAGISSFVNRKIGGNERNALMLAVGALIPLSYGRLGKSWRHVERLHELAEHLANDPSNFEPLEAFWLDNEEQEDEENAISSSVNASPSAMREKRRGAQPSPNGQPRTRNRAVSSASALAPPGQTLSAHHPALSLSTFLDTFGPLVFPLYRAALLRKRILISSQAPVELACNFVYNISILSTIPSAVHDLLPLSPLPTRLRPLFSVGVHDIPTLSTGSRSSPIQEHLANEGQAYGWAACTTDDILSTKSHLFDTLVTLPPAHSSLAESKPWPRLQNNTEADIKATQRDARRYRTFRNDLHRYRSPTSRPQSRSTYPLARYTDTNDEAENNYTAPIFPTLEEAATSDLQATSADDQTPILEPPSWSSVAYNSFIWWASAGESRTDRQEESEYDSALIANLAGGDGGGTPSLGAQQQQRDDEDGPAAAVGFEMAVITYFHRLSALIFRTLGEIVDAEQQGSSAASSVLGREEGTARGGASEQEEEEDSRKEDDGDVVEITSDDLTRMGLDIWSENDRLFVQEMVEFYWGGKALVRGAGVECCGVRVW